MQKIKVGAAGSDASCCRAKVQSETPNVFPLHNRIAIVACSFRRREEPGVFQIRAVQLDCFWVLFLTFGFACIFNISRGNGVHSAFGTSDTRGLYREQRLTRAVRAVVFPCQAWAEPPPRKG